MSYLAESKELSCQSGTIEVGLSWDLIAGSPPVDLDASAVCFSSTGTLVDAVFYNQLTAMNGSITHSGDCKRGEKAGFDEVVKISLDHVKGVNVIVFTINAFSGGSLQSCESALCEIKIENTVLATMSATTAQTGASSALIMCALFRHPSTLNWHFTPIRQVTSGKHFSACLLPIRAVVDQLIDPDSLGERSLNADKTFEMNKGDQLTIPTNLNKLVVGLGWTTSAQKLDLDASCVMLGSRDGHLHPVDLCFFAQKKRPGVECLGDNTSGAGEGDDETMVIHLDQVEKKVTALAIVVTIYTEHRTFAEVQNSYVRTMNDSGTHVYAKYTLNGALTKNGLLFCMLVRGKASHDPWALVTLGEECEGRSARVLRSLQWEGEGGTYEPDGAAAPHAAAPARAPAHAFTEPRNDDCCAIS